MSEQQLDRKDLKIEALRQRLAETSVEHEDRAANYRVEITVLNTRLQEVLNENENLKSQLTATEVSEEDVSKDPEFTK